MKITPETSPADWERGETEDEFFAAGFYATAADGTRGSRVTYLPPGYFGDQQQIFDADERYHRELVQHHRDYPMDPIYN